MCYGSRHCYVPSLVWNCLPLRSRQGCRWIPTSVCSIFSFCRKQVVKNSVHVSSFEESPATTCCFWLKKFWIEHCESGQCVYSTVTDCICIIQMCIWVQTLKSTPNTTLPYLWPVDCDITPKWDKTHQEVPNLTMDDVMERSGPEEAAGRIIEAS